MRVTHTDTSSAEKRFGAQVREAREVRGWSQEALANALREAAGLELHQTAIARLERGERAIRLNEASALAKLLGLDLQAYAGDLPRITSEEYPSAKQSLEKLREQERHLTEELLRLQEQQTRELEDLVRDRRSIVETRRRLEAMIREYEERQGG